MCFCFVYTHCKVKLTTCAEDLVLRFQCVIPILCSLCPKQRAREAWSMANLLMALSLMILFRMSRGWQHWRNTLCQIAWIDAETSFLVSPELLNFKDHEAYLHLRNVQVKYLHKFHAFPKPFIRSLVDSLNCSHVISCLNGSHQHSSSFPRCRL